MAIRKTLISAGLLIAFLSAWGAASEADYQEQIQFEKQYCKMVADRYWPAYNKDVTCPPVQEITK